MPDLPFPVQAANFQELVGKLQRHLDELYDNRVAGALLGDVFDIGDDDILALNLSDTGGLKKTGSELAIKLKTDGGLETTADGLAGVVATTSAPGFTPKLSGNAGDAYRGDGTWSAGGAGNVTGPGASVDSNIVEFNGVAGTAIKDSGLSHADVADAISKKHDRQHSITSGSDHTFPGGTTTFLRADGTFASAGGGSWGNLDNGYPDSTFGGVSPIDCGGVS